VQLTKLLAQPGPQRTLAVLTFVNTFGIGLFVAGSTLYFTRIIGLSPAEVAGGLLVGSLAGLGGSVLAGRFADRVGGRGVQIGAMLSGGITMLIFMLVTSFWAYLLASVLAGLVYAGDRASRAPMIKSFGGSDPVGYSSYLRSVTNLALALGTAAAGVAIELNSRSAYLALLASRGMAFWCCAAVALRLPRPRRPRHEHADRWGVLRDRPFLSATALNAAMSLHSCVPSFLLPLWIVYHTAAPRWMVGGVLVVNTLLVAGAQVPASRGVSDLRTAGQRMRWAGWAIFAGLVLMAVSSGPPGWGAVALLLAGMTVYTLGEMWQAAAATAYFFQLTPAGAQGEYAGVFSLGAGIAESAAPAVLTALPLALGLPGWLAFAAIMLAGGRLSEPVISLSMRSALRKVAPS
jgi:Major Facilitator Superfamily